MDNPLCTSNIGTKHKRQLCGEPAVVRLRNTATDDIGCDCCHSHAIYCQDATPATVVKRYGPKLAGINYPDDADLRPDTLD